MYFDQHFWLHTNKKKKKKKKKNGRCVYSSPLFLLILFFRWCPFLFLEFCKLCCCCCCWCWCCWCCWMIMVFVSWWHFIRLCVCLLACVYECDVVADFVFCLFILSIWSFCLFAMDRESAIKVSQIPFHEDRTTTATAPTPVPTKHKRSKNPKITTKIMGFLLNLMKKIIEKNSLNCACWSADTCDVFGMKIVGKLQHHPLLWQLNGLC